MGAAATVTGDANSSKAHGLTQQALVSRDTRIPTVTISCVCRCDSI